MKKILCGIVILMLTACVTTGKTTATRYLDENTHFKTYLTLTKYEYKKADVAKQQAMFEQLQPEFDKVNRALAAWEAYIKLGLDTEESESNYLKAMNNLSAALLKGVAIPDADSD